jgi:hydrogenase nickel incorporation protein HypB
MMCSVCGCSATGTHGHGHDHVHEAQGEPVARAADLDFGANAARVSVPGMSAARAIQLEADVLGANDSVARANRAHFEAHGVAAYNLVSSPGSGKTTLLVATIEALRHARPELPLAVIEGDQQTRHDADRICATGAPAVQVNTGKGCHLDAPMVAAAFERLAMHAHSHAHDHTQARQSAGSLLFIENVGNLVCPALWDLGERAKVVILSVTEGDDKPLKYPDMFAAATLMVLTKTDLLAHVDFDVARCIEYARRVNPAIEVLLLSAKSGQGMDAWIDWLLDDGQPHDVAAAVPAQDETARLKARIAELEARLAQQEASA